METVKKFFENFNILASEEIDDIIGITQPIRLEKHDYFIRENEVCKSVAFVISGILRSFYLTDNGDDITYCIIFPNHLMTAYSSFITGKGSSENLQAVTPVELLIIPKCEIDKLAQTNPRWVLLLKQIAELQYIELEQRIFMLHKHKANYRYAALLDKYPAYIQNIPLQYLASYLGITQRHLSRIRKEFSLH